MNGIVFLFLQSIFLLFIFFEKNQLKKKKFKNKLSI